MRAALRTTVVLAFTIAVGTGWSSSRARAEGSRPPRGRASSSVPGHIPLKGVGAKVAVQPFEGTNTEPLRDIVVRIVKDRGFRPMTSLPRYEGTGQYPVLAKENRLAAFVTADTEERGRWQSITFLVWSGASGSIVGRWTTSGSSASIGHAVGQGFWAHLGGALRRAQAPKTADDMTPAAPVRIDASSKYDDRHVAEREK